MNVPRVARTAGVPIVEDDAYGRLPAAPLPALAALDPGNVWHVATLSKALSPGPRTADSFAAGPITRNGLRISLGGQARRDILALA